MEIRVGQTVLFARNYKDTPREGVIVRDVGTFYIGTQPPEGVYTVTGRIDPFKGSVAYPIYDKYMNFNRSEVLACINIQPERAKPVNATNLMRGLDISDMLSFQTTTEAIKAYELLQSKHIHCQLRGTTITGISDMERAKLLLKPKEEKPTRMLFRRPKTKFKETNNDDDNFEI